MGPQCQINARGPTINPGYDLQLQPLQALLSTSSHGHFNEVRRGFNFLPSFHFHYSFKQSISVKIL